MASLSRDVIKWLQSLDLSWQVKNPKWDFANGYLVAEILYWYFSREINMHSYNNGKSIESKLKNWHLLREFFKRHQFEFPDEIVEGTIHCREDAAVLFINRLFEILTCKSPLVCCDGNMDDFEYQKSLTYHARSNASKALKNNLSNTQMVVHPDILTNQQKAQAILQRHTENRLLERQQQPSRFGISRSAGERCLRKHPGPAYGERLRAPPERPAESASPDRLETVMSDGLALGEAAPAAAAAAEHYEEEAPQEIAVRQQPKYGTGSGSQVPASE